MTRKHGTGTSPQGEYNKEKLDNLQKEYADLIEHVQTVPWWKFGVKNRIEQELKRLKKEIDYEIRLWRYRSNPFPTPGDLPAPRKLEYGNNPYLGATGVTGATGPPSNWIREAVGVSAYDMLARVTCTTDPNYVEWNKRLQRATGSTFVQPTDEIHRKLDEIIKNLKRQSHGTTISS